MKLFKNVRLLAVLAALAAQVAFAGDSKIVTTYRDPASQNVAFQKIVVAVISSDADLRRRAEGGIARRIRNATAASTLIPDGEIKDAAATRAKISSAGFDGALLVRPLPIQTEETLGESEQVSVYRPAFSNYWDGMWVTVYQPGYMNIEKIVTVEVVAYSLAEGKLIWAARMESTGPKSLRTFLDDFVKAGAAELKKQKLI
jgi:hypothetical protein